MHEYIFHGRVTPERTAVNLTNLGWINFVSFDGKITYDMKVDIILSIITVTVKSKVEIEDVWTTKNALVSTISLLVDCIGFSNGCGYNVEIDTCLYAGGNRFVVFGVDMDIPADSDLKDPIEIISVYGIATNIQKAQLQRSLSEFKLGIRMAEDTGFHSYRAVESIMQTFRDWTEMNNALNLNKSYTKSLKEDYADPQRHGKYTSMTGGERIDLLLVAKTVIKRFIRYVQSGSKPLAKIEYPELI